MKPKVAEYFPWIKYIYIYIYVFIYLLSLLYIYIYIYIYRKNEFEKLSENIQSGHRDRI